MPTSSVHHITLAVMTAAMLAVGAAGCGSARSVTAPPTAASTAASTASIAPTPVTPTPTSATSTTPEPTDLAPPTSTAAVIRNAPSGQAPALIRGIRTGRHDTYDRLVIDFTGPIPGYQLSYVPSLVYDGSGAAVPLTAPAYLRLTLTPANAHDPVSGKDAFTGPKLVTPGLPALRGYALAGDFEAVVTVGIAVSRPDAGFRVISLAGPERLVIDIAH